MADSVASLFEERAEFYKLFTHPLRLRILTLLEVGPCTVTRIAEELDIELPRASQHLALMRRNGARRSRAPRKRSVVRTCLSGDPHGHIIHQIVVKRLNAIGELAKGQEAVGRSQATFVGRMSQRESS